VEAFTKEGNAWQGRAGLLGQHNHTIHHSSTGIGGTSSGGIGIGGTTNTTGSGGGKSKVHNQTFSFSCSGLLACLLHIPMKNESKIRET
jgi:hypothetical protein